MKGLSYPFTTYIFTLMGVGIARNVRGGIGVHSVLGVILILVFIFMGKITTGAATNCAFNPTLAVRLPARCSPSSVFGSIGSDEVMSGATIPDAIAPSNKNTRLGRIINSDIISHC